MPLSLIQAKKMNNNVVPNSMKSEPGYDILTKYLPTETEEEELNQFLSYNNLISKAFFQPVPRLVTRHPTIPRTRRMVTANKRIIDPLDPNSVCGPIGIGEYLARLTVSKDQCLAYKILRPLYWEMSRMFPVEMACFLLSVPSIDPLLKSCLNLKARPTAIQVELQNVNGMYEVFLEFLTSLIKTPNYLFVRLYLLKEYSHHLSIINRYAGASEEPISVSTHSVLCYRIALLKLQHAQYGHMKPVDLKRTLLAVLLHDGGEAYINDQVGFLRDRDDVISIAEACILARIYSSWGIGTALGQLTVADMDFVRECDAAALAFEFKTVCGDPTLELMEAKCTIELDDLIASRMDDLSLINAPSKSSYIFRKTLFSILDTNADEN